MTARFETRRNSRREFIRCLGATTVLGLCSPVAGPLTGLASTAEDKSPVNKTLVGSNIYGWGQYYQRDKKKLDISEVLASLHDLGYDYLEGNLDTAAPDNNAKLAEQMKAKGLVPVTLYTGARLHEPDQAKEVIKKILAAAQVCHQAGFQALSCNADPIGREKTEAELNNQAAALTELGLGLRELGIHLGVHQHLPEMANQAREFHYNFRHTDPRIVGFCFDVHWVYRGGVMPMDALQEYGNRVVSWHIRQSRNGIWWEDLDTGDIDYGAVAKYAREHGLARLFTVELALETATKITRSGLENHKRSREFIRRVFESQI